MNSQKVSQYKMEQGGYSALRVKYAHACVTIRVQNTIIRHLQADVTDYRQESVQHQAMIQAVQEVLSIGVMDQVKRDKSSPAFS
jgi:hypothetical protein